MCWKIIVMLLMKWILKERKNFSQCSLQLRTGINRLLLQQTYSFLNPYLQISLPNAENYIILQIV